MQIKPTSPFSGIVRHFLIIESDRQSAMRIFSDGNTGIVFNYGDPLSYQPETNSLLTPLPGCFIYGQLDSYRNVWATGKIRLLIAVLHPFGAAALLRLPASELRNQIIGCDHFCGRNAAVIAEEMALSCSIPDKIRLVEQFLLSRLQDSSASNSFIANAVSVIHAHNGLLPVSRLIEITGVTERQIQRKFEEHIGISPKRYAVITRMQYALKMFRKRTDNISFAGIACESGFFDQAHLIREMKKLSGLTPSQYLSPQNLLAANLIQIGQ